MERKGVEEAPVMGKAISAPMVESSEVQGDYKHYKDLKPEQRI